MGTFVWGTDMSKFVTSMPMTMGDDTSQQSVVNNLTVTILTNEKTNISTTTTTTTTQPQPASSQYHRPSWEEFDRTDFFCRRWDDDDDFDVDEWWIHHPEWDTTTSHDNETHYCMRRHHPHDPKRLEFIHNVYQVQWKGNCSKVQQQYMINSGYGASLMAILKPFYSVMIHGKFTQPFQMTKHWDGAVWLFSTTNNASWAYCPAHDMTCYLLPISQCQPQYRIDPKDTVPNYRADPYRKIGVYNQPKFVWLRQYAVRYRKKVRRR
eukprot:scaffold44678_cov451-Amphora_coffeaeformis.AAC.1